MSEYLSKEEIKQWRSSLEKITLEEFAARLGKKVEEKKETNDLIDIVLHGKPVISEMPEYNSRVERLSAIADRAYEREKDLYVSPFSAQNLTKDAEAPAKKETKSLAKKAAKSKAKPETEPKKRGRKPKIAIEKTKIEDQLRNGVRFVFKKALTDREQRVFDYFASHMDTVVYAKDLAELLALPRDYVYKYIKNLRAKIDGEALKNADKGGFVLSAK